MSRCLGVDYGTCRVGLALSDETGTIASALETITIRGARHAAQTIAEICQARNVPLDLQGRVGPAAKSAQQFADLLHNVTALPVKLWDERLSTAMAEKLLIDGGTRRARRRDLRDQIAAQIVLQSYLDAQAL